MSATNKQIGGRAPAKRQINLISKEKPRTNFARLFGIVFLVLVILAGIGYYGYNAMQKIDRLSSELIDRGEELLLLKFKSSEYDEVEEDYVRYSFAHLTAAEKSTVSPLLIIKKIEELVVPYGFVTEMQIQGNTVSFTLYSEDIRQVTDSLRADPMVVTVTPRSESKQESAETIIVTENVSAMIMKTIGGVQVISRSDETADGEETGEETGKEGTVEKGTGEVSAEAAEKSAEAEEKKAADGGTEIYLNTEGTLMEGDPNVQVTIVIPPVLSTAQLSVTFQIPEGTKDEQ